MFTSTVVIILPLYLLILCCLSVRAGFLSANLQAYNYFMLKLVVVSVDTGFKWPIVLNILLLVISLSYIYGNSKFQGQSLS
jgi:hypothetical protein